MTRKAQLGALVQAMRETRGTGQEAVATACGTNRTAVAHLEQGLKLPERDTLERICAHVGVPRKYWEDFVRPESAKRFDFEDVLSELVGEPVSLDAYDVAVHRTAEACIGKLFDQTRSNDQTRDLFNTILLYYGVPQASVEFFGQYLGPAALSTVQSFEESVERYQKDAVRLFSTLKEAYRVLNTSGALSSTLAPLQARKLDAYYARMDWNEIESIPEERLPDLGYISAATIRQEAAERASLHDFLQELATAIRTGGPQVLDTYSEKKKRRIDSLMRKFGTRIEHGLFSPLFAPDPDDLDREASRLAPKSDEELDRIAGTQAVALRNLSRYLAADYMDVYVATSMRTDPDFVSVNRFVERLFQHRDIKPLKLRFFNPTQSWVEDRISKGLVEALMLRRADMTIYMAQKSDTFGKDSEASVALGQGKPVIVYVPKLSVPSANIDSETLFQSSREELSRLVRTEKGVEEKEVDQGIDDESLVARILTARLRESTAGVMAEVVQHHWSDFDLYEEATRVAPPRRAAYRAWLDDVRSAPDGKLPEIPTDLREDLTGILVAAAIRFEKRARVFREIHPLALQVVLSSGVLNGILVVRSVNQCAAIIGCLVTNRLELRRVKDDINYRLVEATTGSTIRVISRNRLVLNSFEAYYNASRKAALPH